MGIFSLNFTEREWKCVEWEFLLSNGHLGIMARNHPLESLIKVWGSKMILSDRQWRWAHRKIILTLSRGRNQPFNRGFFQVFQKLWKVAILLCEFLHENSIYRKNEVLQDEANGKSFETVTSFFWFLKLCHRDFSPQSLFIFFFTKNVNFNISTVIQSHSTTNTEF